MRGQRKKYKNSEAEIPEVFQEVFDSVCVPSSTHTKEEVWAMLMEKIEKQESSIKSKPLIRVLWTTIAVAASVVILIGIAYFKYATVTVNTTHGQQLPVDLPDGSIARLNACSQIQYARYWFFNRREIKLAGEAFFIVQKGKTFTVLGNSGHKVEVVGTQFNVIIRDSNFKVTCFEGKVRVVTRSGKSTTLSQGYSSAVIGDSILVQKTIGSLSEKPSWTMGEFYFESSSLQEVIEELMRQYNVSIYVQGFDPRQRFYTGYFTNNNLKQALDWVTLPMNLQYTFLNDTLVNIYPKP